MKLLNLLSLPFLCLMIMATLQAEMPFTDLKGSYPITLLHPQLAPLNGMVWAEQRIVENMYRYGNPKDGTIQLIKELFYLQPDNVSFRPTILKSKPAVFLDQADIGFIMTAITAYRENQNLDEMKRTTVPVFLNLLEASLEVSIRTRISSDQIFLDLV